MMTGILVAICGFLGLLIGSFLNVVIWRLPRGESLSHPASHCPACEHPIRPYDNVPVVSWLMLRGTCRDCRAGISARYPAVELATGLLFAATSWRIGAHPALAGFLFLTAAGVALAMIDVDTKRLPNALVFPTYAVGLLAFVVDAAAGDHWWRLARAVLAMSALFSFYFVTRLLGELVLRKPAMGFGDVKLAGALGLFLGWLGWGALFVGAFAGFMVGAVGGLALVLSGRGTLASRIPYGPYMLAGAFIAVMGGQQLAHAYLRLAAG